MPRVLLVAATVLGVIAIAEHVWHPIVTAVGQQFDDGYNLTEATHGARTDLDTLGY